MTNTDQCKTCACIVCTRLHAVNGYSFLQGWLPVHRLEAMILTLHQVKTPSRASLLYIEKGSLLAVRPSAQPRCTAVEQPCTITALQGWIVEKQAYLH